MKSLGEIQSGLRFSGRHGDETITSGDGLRTFNRMYRAFALAFPWPELRRTHALPDTTTAGTGTYDWFTALEFADVRSVSVEDGDDRDEFKIVPPAPNEIVWERSGRKADQAVPDFHLLFRHATDEKTQIEFRPAFKYAGKTINVTGIREPDELKNEAQRTVFRQRLADDALELLLAAEFLAVDGSEFAQTRLGQAQQLLSRLFGRDIQPEELPVRL